MTKDIKFLEICMEKEKVSLTTTKNPRLQKIIEKRIILYEEQIKVLEEIEKKEIKDTNVLDYLFKGIKKYITESWTAKTVMPRLEPHEQKIVQKKFLKNLLANELPKNCNIKMEFYYDYAQDSYISIDLDILENNTLFFRGTLVNVSKEELVKIAIFYIKRGGKLEKQVQNKRKDCEEVIKQNSAIIRRRKKFLKILKEFETAIKAAAEDKEE